MKSLLLEALLMVATLIADCASPSQKPPPAPLAEVFRSAARAWRPQARPPTPDWCANNLRLPAETSADPGAFDLKTRPYWREPLEMLDDPDVQTISIMADAQRGKTVLIQAAILSRSKLDPAPAMLAGPDQDAIRELRDRLYAMALESPAVKASVPPKRLWNDRWIDLQSMYCYLAWSGSPQRLRGRTCKWVFCTEVDVWQDSPRLGSSATLIKARVKAFAEFKIVYESTPSDENSTIAALDRRGDQRRYHVPCPHCRRYQELRFFPHKSGKYAGKGGIAGLQDDKGNWLSADEAREQAYYVCENGCRIESSEKLDMIDRGRWCPKGCRVIAGDGASHTDGSYPLPKLKGKPDRSRRNVSYQISALYGEDSFGTIAAAYLEHREAGKLREFFNNWLGLPYQSAAAMPNWKTLGRRLSSTHRRGTVPAECWFLTAAGDVQDDRAYWQVKGWGDRTTSWLIDWGILKREAGEQSATSSQMGLLASDLAQFDEAVLNVRWPIVGGLKNPRGLTELGVRVLGIDAGHRITDVHAYLRAHPGDRVRAIHGDHKVDPAQLYRMNLVEKNARTGKPYEGGLQLWGIYVYAYYRDLLDRFAIPLEQPGSIRLPSDVFDGGEDLLRQLVNQSPVTETLASGKQVTRWIVRDKAVGEHYWDTEVYNRCLADMVTGGDWDAGHWARGRRSEVGSQTKDEPETRQANVAARDNFADGFGARD